MTAPQPELEDGEVLIDQITISRIQHPEYDGDNVEITHSNGMGWVTQLGLVEAARQIIRSGDDE